MSQMASLRSSVFTYMSTAHSSHVLQCLNEQRCRDFLCDVTVVVEGKSFRAHRSVLASCSDYFAQRISSLVQHGAVITLPAEVTAVGFEPLLMFAYTSKLHFGKEDVLEIQNSASILGFRDLDEACFDFLLPKFFSSNKGSAPFVRKSCCKKTCKRQFTKDNGDADSDGVTLDNKEAKPVADSSSQQDAARGRSKSVKKKTGSVSGAVSLGTAVEEMDVAFLQCPKYRKFQLACEKESGVTEKGAADSVKSRIRDGCFTCLPSPSSPCFKIKTAPNKEVKGGAEEPQKNEIDETDKDSSGATWRVDTVKKDVLERAEKWEEKVAEKNWLREKMEHTSGTSFSDVPGGKLASPETSPVLDKSPSQLVMTHCPSTTLAQDHATSRSVKHEKIVTSLTETQKAKVPVTADPASIHQNAPAEAEGERPHKQDGGKGRQTGNMERTTIPIDNTRERSTSDREVADHLSKWLTSNKGAPQPNFHDSEAGRSDDSGTGWVQSPSLEWPNLQNNLCSTKTSCPFLLDLDPMSCLSKPGGMSECEVASQSGISSFNSGEDGDSETETEGDCEFSTSERVIQVQLPFSVEWVVSLSRNDFQQLLKQQAFTREQLDFVHDMRRRSKNRLAAQRCRKRKLDCIYNLQCEINKLKTEREKLIVERKQLSQMKLKTCHSVTALCQRVCDGANLQSDELQVLAQYTTSDCPLSSLFPHIDSVLSQHGLPLHPLPSLMPSSGGLELVAPEEDLFGSNRDRITGQQPL